MNELTELRRAKDHAFKHDPHSPLTAEQRQAFQGLRYFPENPALRFTVPLDQGVEQEILQIPTSTGGEQALRRAGHFHITIDGEPVTLTAYGDLAEGELFIPFRDQTSGQESYGAGRYLEAHVLEGRFWLVDFNFAYNPYCAYNEQWTCPLPPIENWLRAPIRAGEQAFHA